MAKKIVGFIKLQIPAGKANPSPPVGPALGQRGLNIMEFCKAFNAQTQGYEPGLKLPVVITAFADKSFTFVLKSPPATVLLKKAAKIEKGSGRAHLDKVGKVTRAQLEEIAKVKIKDLTAADMDAAVKTIAGSGDWPVDQPLSAGEIEALVGTYRFGPGERDVFEIAPRKGGGARGQLTIQRPGGAPRNLFHLGERIFQPAGAEPVRVKFSAEAPAKTLTLPGALATRV